MTRRSPGPPTEPSRAGRDGPSTPTLPAFLRAGPTVGEWFLSLKVQPRASRTGVDGEHGGELKLRVTAPPVDAAANQAVIDLLATLLDLPRRQVELVRGQTSRHKLVRISGAERLPWERLRPST